MNTLPKEAAEKLADSLINYGHRWEIIRSEYSDLPPSKIVSKSGAVSILGRFRKADFVGYDFAGCEITIKREKYMSYDPRLLIVLAAFFRNAPEREARKELARLLEAIGQA